MVRPVWGATSNSGRELTQGCYALKQKYHLPSPPPLQFFLLLHMYLKVISAMRRPFQAIYVGVWSIPAPSSWPPTPPPPPRRESGTEAGRSWRMAHCPDPPGAGQLLRWAALGCCVMSCRVVSCHVMSYCVVLCCALFAQQRPGKYGRGWCCGAATGSTEKKVV